MGESEIDMLKVLLMIVILIFGVFAWACCMAAATADEHAEELYRDYLEHKQRKERSNNGIDEEED